MYGSQPVTGEWRIATMGYVLLNCQVASVMIQNKERIYVR